MAALYPFRALRPRPADAAQVAAVPYDVVSTDEARALADGNPLSFLRVSRAEIELPPATDPLRRRGVRARAAEFRAAEGTALVVEAEPSVYFYRLRMGPHVQTGLAACFSLDEYDRDIIKKHERTRPDKEDDRTRHMIALGAQTGPVFLTYRASADVDRDRRRASLAAAAALRLHGGRRRAHTIWRVGGADRDALVAAFGRIPALYIADGHHRAASAARRARTRVPTDARWRRRRRQHCSGASPFRTTRCRSLPYNRIVQGPGRVSPDGFIEAVARALQVEPRARRRRRGAATSRCTSRAAGRRCGRALRPIRPTRSARSTSASCRNSLLAPVLEIADVRTDKRIDFVGGARGTASSRRWSTRARRRSRSRCSRSASRI